MVKKEKDKDEQLINESMKKNNAKKEVLQKIVKQLSNETSKSKK